MEINQFTQKCKEQFIDADTIVLEPDTQFRKIGSYDSLTGMAILVMIQDEFGFTMQEDVYKSLNTPKELLEYINSNK